MEAFESSYQNGTPFAPESDKTAEVGYFLVFVRLLSKSASLFITSNKKTRATAVTFFNYLSWKIIIPLCKAWALTCPVAPLFGEGERKTSPSEVTHL